MLTLRRLENEDVDIVKDWLMKEYVAQWFGDASEWLFEINHRHEQFAFIKHFIAEENGVPIGFCQYYNWNKAFEEDMDSEPSGSFGIDYMLGEESMLGKGLGKQLVKLICEKVISEQPEVALLIADPTMEEARTNITSIKVLEANGFQYDKNTKLYKKDLKFGRAY